MALPKEPRQKMINLMYLVLTALLALNVSAEVIDAFTTVDKSLTQSNANIDKANQTLIKSFEAKKKEAATAARAADYGAKAERAKALSATMYKYLDDLKTELMNNSGYKVDENGVATYKKDELNASSRIMDTEGKGKA